MRIANLVKRFYKTKKGQIGNLQSIIITLVVVGMVLGIGFLVLDEFKDAMTTGSNAQQATNTTITALAKVPTWLGIIVILAIVGILLGIIFTVLPRSSGGGI